MRFDHVFEGQDGDDVGITTGLQVLNLFRDSDLYRLHVRIWHATSTEFYFFAPDIEDISYNFEKPEHCFFLSCYVYSYRNEQVFDELHTTTFVDDDSVDYLSRRAKEFFDKYEYLFELNS